MNQDLGIASLTGQIKRLGTTLRKYYGIIFIGLVSGVYLFLIMQTNSLVNAQPNEADIKADTMKKLLVKDEVANKLELLRDNSVGVQSIIDEERDNPFQE